MRILIDADACPVWRETIDVARRHGVPVLIFADTAHYMESDYGEVIISDLGADMADFAILNRLVRGDLVITQDYGLAALVLARGGLALNQDGMEYTNSNIDNLLERRHIGREIRAAGGRTKGPNPRKREQNAAFIAALESILNR